MRFFITIVLGLTFLIGSIGSADAKRNPDIVQAENWLRDLKTAQSRFIQISPDGTQKKGEFYIERPGKLRFEYDGDPADFIVADGVFVYFYEAASRQQTNAPIGMTLADFLLKDDLRLYGDVTVKRVFKTDTMTQITMVQTENPENGQLILGFQHKPYALKKWRVIDAQGLITEVELGDLETGISLDAGLFHYINPETGKAATYNE